MRQDRQDAPSTPRQNLNLSSLARLAHLGDLGAIRWHCGSRLLYRLVRVLPRRIQRLGQLLRVFPAPLGHLGSAPASAAGGFGGFLDPVAGLETLFDQVVADGGDEADLAVLGRAEEDG